MQRKQFTSQLQARLQTVVVRIAVAVAGTAFITAMALGILGSNANASNLSSIATVPESIVYRSPDCSCCGGWITHLKAYGFKLKDFTTTDIEAVKQKYNVPDELASCHTAIIAGYIIEGHVPASDIKRLLTEQPDVVGLSVPQMPVGTPGMELGNHKDPFSVLSFSRNGKVAVFSDYPSD
jgi:hypothetical protein